MKSLSITALTLLVGLCTTTLALAQDRSSTSGEFRIGLSGGATYNDHPGIVGGRIPTMGCPHEESSNWKWGYSAGGVVEYRLNSMLGIASHILYSTHPGSGTERHTSHVLLPSPDPEDPPTLVNQVVQAEAQARYDLLLVDAVAKVRLLPIGEGGLGVAVGFAVGRTITHEESWLQRLIAPSNARFVQTDKHEMRDSGRVIVFSENEPLGNSSSTRLSMRGGVFCDLGLSDRLRVTPGAYYDYGLTNLTTDSYWKVNAWLLQLDVTMKL